MRNRRLPLLFLLAALIACGDDPEANTPDDNGDADVEQPAQSSSSGSSGGAGPASPPRTDAGAPDGSVSEPEEPPPPPPAECPTLTEGVNTIQLNGKERRFWIVSPKATTPGPRAAIFWFHGFSGSRAPETDALADGTMLDQLGIVPDADPSFPFVRVLLEDTNLQPFNGLDWDIRTDEPNVDLELFDTVVACVRSHRAVAQDRVFAAGFSAGATFANLLHSARGEVVRAVYTASGLWVNEPANKRAAQRVTVIPSLVRWDWPELGAIEPNHAAVLLTYGDRDNVPGSPVTVSLRDAGRAAADWLVDHGRLVVECGHAGGHTLHPEVNGALVLRFFAAHVGAGASSWASNPGSLPASCRVRGGE